MTTPQQIMDVERGELGQTENPRGSNRQKYSLRFGVNGVAWCGWFQTWCYYEAGIDLRRWCDNPGYTPNLFGDLAALGWAIPVSQAGPADLIFFNFPGGHNRIEHVGAVEENRWPVLHTIEGNTSGKGSQTNGGAVLRKQRTSSFAGAIRVPMDRAKHETAADQLAQLRLAINYAKLGFHDIGTPTENTARPGRVEAIKLLQTGLNRWFDRLAALAHKPSPPDIPVSGWWDGPTRQAVISLQQIAGFNEYGTVGPKTWAAIYPD